MPQIEKSRSFVALRTTLVLAMTIIASAAGAQRPTLSSLQTGDTLKVWAVNPRLNGVVGGFSAFRSDTLMLAALPVGASPVIRANVPYAALRRMELRRGERRSAFRITVGIVGGAFVAGALGGAIGVSAECKNGCSEPFGGVAGFLGGAATGILVGGVTGGLIGARKRPHWVPVTLQR